MFGYSLAGYSKKKNRKKKWIWYKDKQVTTVYHWLYGISGQVQPFLPMYLIYFDTKITIHEGALIYRS